MRALPQDVLVLVLRHVDQAERLSTCALVSTAWAKAAVMASDSLKVYTNELDPFMPWLQHHGSHITCFTCECVGPRDDRGVLGTLPCSNLLSLTLVDSRLSLGPMLGWPGILQVATGLTSLDLNMGDQEDFVGGLLSLTALHALPALQRFDLSVREDLGLDAYQPSDADELPCCVISGLTTLTMVYLRGVLALESLQPFSLLTKLQHLDLDLQLGVSDTDDAVQSGQQPFQQLHALTFLSIGLMECKLVSTSSSPAFAGCTGLQSLYLFSPMVDASAFQGLTGLRLLNVWVHSAIENSAVGGLAALLSHIASMQQLQRLVLSKGSPAAAVALEDADAELCRAVTASSHLTYLDLSGIRLPQAAWAHLFPPGRRLLQLCEFEVYFAGPHTVWQDYGTELLDCSALEQLVDCCPAITALTLSNMSLFKQDVSLVPLLRLRHLAQLSCPYVADGAASVGVLARLSSLTSLHLRALPGLTDSGLLQLTALTGLQALTVYTPTWRDVRRSVAEGQPELHFRVSTLGCWAIASC